MKNDRLDELLSEEEPGELISGNKKFEPKFNVREEFALWVREQFPELRKYARGRGNVYKELEERREEVYEAALGAVNHGVVSTETCASSRLSSGWTKFEKGFKQTASPKKRAKSLMAFVEAVEDLSISLGGDEHFTEAGRFLNGGSYFGNFNAFVYRIGDEHGKDAKYLMFGHAQEFDEENNGETKPVLIGEITQLTKWELERLQKIVSKFKGPEVAFIQHVDKAIPEGGYSSRPYGSGYARRSSPGIFGTLFGWGPEDD